MIPPVFQLAAADVTVKGMLGTNPTRLYPFGQTPDAITYPYSTWQTITGLPENQLSGPPPCDRIGVQLDVWAKEADECFALSEALRDCLEPHAHMTFFGNTERDSPSRSYRQTLTFDFWLNR